MSSTTMTDTTFSKLSDDIILQILFQLEDDPRNWAILCCVSTKFNSLITSICCKSKCLSSFHNSTPSDLVSLSTVSGGWASLYKIAVCCPGVLHGGVLLDNSDFGLHRELGPTQDYYPQIHEGSSKIQEASVISPLKGDNMCLDDDGDGDDDTCAHEFGGWSLYDDLYFDTVYDNSETPMTPVKLPRASSERTESSTTSVSGVSTSVEDTVVLPHMASEPSDGEGEMYAVLSMKTDPTETSGTESSKRRKVTVSRILRSHLASGGWSLSREEGKKLLASRFRDDCLYISEWPGCVHIEEKRSYRLFRGVFSNFKGSRVWRTINDAFRSKTELNCAFCKCKETWDLHSAFCLKRGFGFHDDGEPVVRAYVCENGHVSGAWTDLPLYA